jgi:phosphomevalonate kinase
MIARAPGKVVVSGAYAVLEGAPAVVAAVDRYVVADTSRPTDFTTPEVRAALGEKPAPWFDASALRAGDKKLGLGSSAAILVASLACIAAENENLEDAELAAEIFEPALVAHRTAQGGGSGVDVAASAFGGTIIAVSLGTNLDVEPTSIPVGLAIEVLFAGVPASTPALIGRVKALKASSRAEYDTIMRGLMAAAAEAASAFEAGSATGVVAALRAQLRGLTALGEHAGAPIVTREVAVLADRAEREGAVVLPAGAGGGDVALFVGLEPPSDEMRRAFAGQGHERLDLRLGARGVHRLRSIAESR